MAKSPLSSAELQAEVGNADALIVALDDVDAAVIAAAPNLKVIAKHGVGVDNIDVAAATQAGVVVVNAPGTNSSAVADLVMGLLLAVQRHIIDAHLSLLAGRWDRFHGPELAGKTIGICGFGRIGRGRCTSGRILDGRGGLRSLSGRGRVRLGRAGQASSVEALVVEADVLTLHLPGGGDLTAAG